MSTRAERIMRKMMAAVMRVMVARGLCMVEGFAGLRRTWDVGLKKNDPACCLPTQPCTASYVLSTLALPVDLLYSPHLYLGKGRGT